MKNILVPIDGSTNSDQALNKAIEFAKKFDAHIFILHVIDTTRLYGGSSAGIFAEMESSLKTNSSRLLKQSKERAETAGIKTTVLLTNGPMKQDISTNIPQKYNIDHIVMGKTGKDGISRLMLGSTTAYVIRKAEVDVTVVGM